MRKIAISLAALLCLSQVGCIKKMLIAGQASSTRVAASALDEVGDLTVARTAAMNGLATAEGMHKLSPNNEDILFILTKGWTAYGFAFVQDDMEKFEEGTEDYDLNKKLARQAFERAVKYGLELMSHTDDGFEKNRKNDAQLKAWLKEHFTDKEDAETLFWAGYAWFARVSIARDEPAMVADLWVGVAMVERSYELDPDYNHSTALTAMAAYHARSSSAEMDEAKKLFELALVKTNRKAMMVQLNYATRYACLKGDRALYDSLIKEVVNFDDATQPDMRLTNAIAKRGARKAMTKQALVACGFDPNVPVAVKKASNLDQGEVNMDDFMAKPGSKPATTAAPTPPPPAATTTATAPASTAPPATTVPPAAGTGKPKPPGKIERGNPPKPG